MKIYFANMNSAKGIEKYLRFQIDVLAAYPSFPKAQIVRNPFVKDLFVDSGAFGKNSGNVEIEQYSEFLHSQLSKIEIYANLDVIGNPNQTWKNQIWMEKESLSPIPVFHYGTDHHWLNRYIRKGYSYIAFGGMVGKNTNKLIQWLDPIWEDYICDNKGVPKIKIHGFGIQNETLIKKYPWYSIDARSTHIMARYGGIYTPWGTFKINPKVNSNEMKWQIKTPTKLQLIKNFVISYLPKGVSFEDAQSGTVDGTLIRAAISIHYLSDLFKQIACKRFQCKKSYIF